MSQITESSGDSDTADVVVRPPKLFLGGLIAAAVLELIYPIGPGLLQGGWKPKAIGLAFAAAGLAIAWRSVARFRSAGTTVSIGEPTETLVTDGLYAVSRNPIYIGLIILFFGLALALTSGWALLLLPALVAVLHKGVVLREEVFLQRKFGAPYAAYMTRVPRWL